MLTLSDFQTFLPPCILSAADNADWCRKTRTAVSQLSLLLKHHIIAVTFCLPPRRAVLRSLVPPLTPTYTKVYATSCYCSQSRDILGYVLSLLWTCSGAFFQPPQKTQCNDRFAKKNGISLPKLFWPTVRKKRFSDQEKLLIFEAEGREFSKFLRSHEQFIQTVKGQNNFW